MLSRELVLRRHLRALLLGVCAMTGILLLALAGVSQAATTRSYTGTSFGPSGVGSGSFNEVSSIAVDKAHNVYVLDRTGEEGRIYKFNSAGAPVEFSSTW